jgi:magnesium chelatase family protein
VPAKDLARTESVAIIGTEGRLIEVEIHIGGGLPRFTTVGLPTTSVREAEQRTRAALASSGYEWPKSHIVANLAPGGLRKEGTHFDLPIALGILVAQGKLESEATEGWVVMGELALDGSARPVRGVLPAAITTKLASRQGLICPVANAAEASIVQDLKVVPVASLQEALRFLQGDWLPGPVTVPDDADDGAEEDLLDVRGHLPAKKALEVAAAGGHNILLEGAPGSGKTMLAHRFPGILPEMTEQEALDVTRIYSVAGLLGEHARVMKARPFRSPHQHISVAGLVGGGSGLARPGEISLAHHGALFLDELTLYRSEVLESLRAPLEEHCVRIARSGGTISYPCSFALVAAMNPCPCGFNGDPCRSCRCSDVQIQRYRTKLSGPLIDRIDISVGVPRLTKDELLHGNRGEPSGAVRARVEEARALQRDRFSSSSLTNSTARRARLDPFLRLSKPASRLLAHSIETASLTGRGVDRALRVARTCADLDHSETITEEHMCKALQLRLFDSQETAAA